MFPIPKAVIEVKAANNTASHFIFNPRSSTYIGPPAILPSGIFTLYLTASNASLYFVDIPKTPVNHIHNTAPGPPAATALDTPTIFPVPIVAASAVVNAPN